MNRAVKVIASIFLLSISVACLSISKADMQGYELSIYRGTPIGFWVGIGAALSISIITAGWFEGRRWQLVGAAGGAIAITIIVGLPFLSGYVFFGQSDPLQHLGWAKDIAAHRPWASLNPYPGLHWLGVALHSATGLPLNRTLLLTVPVVYGIFCAGVSLLTRELSPQGLVNGRLSPEAIALALTTATPIIIGVRLPRLQPIATVAGLCLVPLTVWIGLTWLFNDRRPVQKAWLPAFLILGCGLLLFHPQQSLAAASLLSTTLLVTVLIERHRAGAFLRPGKVIAGLLALGAALYFWLITRRVFVSAIGALTTGFLADTSASQTVSPGSAFSAIGGSVPLLFAKTLSVQAAVAIVSVVVFVVVGTFVVRAWYNDDWRSISTSTRKIFAFLVGFVPILVLFVVYLAANGPAQALRYAGLLVGLGTPVVAIALYHIQRFSTPRMGRGAVALVILVAATVATPAMFGSPYIYVGNSQVTEAQLTGYDWLFEHTREGPISSVDTDVQRQIIALYGYRPALSSKIKTIGSSRGDTLAAAHFNESWVQSINSSWYLVSTASAREQQIGLYNELRFSERDFQRLSLSRGGATIYSNGDVRVRRLAGPNRTSLQIPSKPEQ